MKWNDLNCTSSKSSASAKVGKRRNSAGNAIRISMRASGAPRQWCTPWPNARCPGAPRPMSSISGESMKSRIPIARRHRHEHEFTRRNRYAGDLDLGGGDPRDRAVHDRQPAQQFLDGGPYGVGIVADRGELFGMPQ